MVEGRGRSHAAGASRSRSRSRSRRVRLEAEVKVLCSNLQEVQKTVLLLGKERNRLSSQMAEAAAFVARARYQLQKAGSYLEQAGASLAQPQERSRGSE